MSGSTALFGSHEAEAEGREFTNGRIGRGEALREAGGDLALFGAGEQAHCELAHAGVVDLEVLEEERHVGRGHDCRGPSGRAVPAAALPGRVA